MPYSDNPTQFDESNAHREVELSASFSTLEQISLKGYSSAESFKAPYDIEHIAILSDN